MGLDTVELVMAIEEEFDIRIPDAEAENMIRVGDMHAFLVKTLHQRNGYEVTDSEPIWTRLQNVIVQQLGVQPEDVTPAARFIDDLRMD